MNEAEARQWIIDRFGVPRETSLAQMAEMIIRENASQNLLAAPSIATIWSRHIADSAQLVDLAGDIQGPWIDIGTGAGFPGMVVALLTDIPVTLIEPRRRRADFLAAMVAQFGLGARVRVEARRAQQVQLRAAVISARAVAALPELLAAGAHLAHSETLWLLPKGRSALEEVAAAKRTWHGSFHVKQSITEPGSLIITAKGVARR